MLASSVTSLTDPALPDIFYPFGTDVGDSILPVLDDVSSPQINIATRFPFFNVSRSTVYVSLLSVGWLIDVFRSKMHMLYRIL